MTRFIQFSLVLVCGLLFATEAHAQLHPKQEKVLFASDPGVPVGLTGMNSETPKGYTKYYLCFTAEGVPSYLSAKPAPGTPVLDQPFTCPEGTTFQMRIVQYDGSLSFIAEKVNDVAVASNEMVVRIQ